MAVTHIHTYLVAPREADGEQRVGTPVPLEGKLFGLLRDVYAKSENECEIDISFNPRADGAQQNPVRDAVLAYLHDPSEARGRHIAQALMEKTTNRSGQGLLFLISGEEDGDRKIVISRFPADSGILAEEGARGLNVEFLEKVFLKNQFTYKAAVFSGPSLVAGFWLGRAVDKQSSSPYVRVSDYWIKGFLDADFRTTAAMGTRRLATSLRNAVSSAQDPAVKGELTAAATLAAGLGAQETSITEFQERFGLSDAAREAMNRHVRNPATLAERFEFTDEEFAREITYRSVVLDTGVVLSAQAAEFDDVFEVRELDGGRVEISTTGVIVNERLRRAGA